MDIKVMAEVYRLGIAIGYFTVQDVIDWADALIGSLEQPPYELIDISLSSKATPIDVCSLLHSFFLWKSFQRFPFVHHAQHAQ